MTRNVLALLLAGSCLAVAACASSTTPTGAPSQQSEPTVPGDVIPAPSDEGTPTKAPDAGHASSSSSSSSGGSSSGGSSSGGSSSGGSSSGSSGTPPPPSVTEQCTPIGTSCAAGGGMEYCITYTGGACSKIVYKYAGKTYACGGAACGSDCTPAYYQAYTACQDAVGACNDLAACCNVIADAYYPSCAQTYNTYAGQAYGDVTCKSTLDSYRTSNLCP